jgi:hypothetical protein
LNPYAPDLRKSAIREGGDALAIAISAGQVMIAMCPRGDLNPEIGEISLYLDLNSKTGEKSPGRGVHAANDTPDGRAAARFPGALTLCPRVAADNRVTLCAVA